MEKYNGKTITIKHLKADGSIETFSEICENGGVTVIVDELSPFVLTAQKSEVNTEENQNTVKTGDSTNIALYILLILSGCMYMGAYAIRRKRS